MIRSATIADVEVLANMRFALWPDETLETRRAETRANVMQTDGLLETLLAVDGDEVVGFAEVSLRTDYVNGCETSPVAFLEGIYVRRDNRRQGLGRALVSAAERWGRERGCAELASDALLANQTSHRFHSAIGFEETARVVYFRRAVAER